jgi:hypothetical protein
MSNRTAFTSSSISSQKEIKKVKRKSKSGKVFFKVCFTIICVVVIFFLSV